MVRQTAGNLGMKADSDQLNLELRTKRVGFPNRPIQLYNRFTYMTDCQKVFPKTLL